MGWPCVEKKTWEKWSLEEKHSKKIQLIVRSIAYIEVVMLRWRQKPACQQRNPHGSVCHRGWVYPGFFLASQRCHAANPVDGGFLYLPWQRCIFGRSWEQMQVVECCVEGVSKRHTPLLLLVMLFMSISFFCWCSHPRVGLIQPLPSLPGAGKPSVGALWTLIRVPDLWRTPTHREHLIMNDWFDLSSKPSLQKSIGIKRCVRVTAFWTVTSRFVGWLQ